MAFTVTLILKEAGSRIQGSQREFSRRDFKYQSLMGIIYFDMKLFRLWMEFDHCIQDVAYTHKKVMWLRDDMGAGECQVPIQ